MRYVFYYDLRTRHAVIYVNNYHYNRCRIVSIVIRHFFCPPTGEADDEEVRKIQIGEKVDRGDGDVGPAIEIELEPPPADGHSASSASVDLDEEEEEVIRIESIEVTTLEPGEVEELKVRGGIGAAK